MERDIDLQHFQDKLKKINAEFDDFAYIISHDLKASLRAVGFLSEWITEDLGDNGSVKVNENLALLNKRVNVMQKMIDAITVYSRVSRHHLDQEEIDLTALIMLIKNDVEVEFPNVTINYSAENVSLFSFKQKLAFVIEEITRNACMHSDKIEGITKVVNIIIRQSQGFIEISISDNGSGLDQDNDKLNKFFDMFYTSEPKEKTGRVGSGLSICKKILEFVNGDISLEINEDKGLTVKIKWPLKFEA
jgi:signal transduction histidine kinase